MRKAVVAVFHILFLGLPFVFTPINDELFEFNKMLVVYAAAIIVAGLWTYDRWKENTLTLKSSFFLWPLALWFTSQLLSTLFSIDPHTSWFGYYSRFHGGLLSTIAYLTLFFLARQTWRKEDVRPLLRSLVLGSLGVSLYAIPEKLGVSPSCILITHQFNATCWVQDVQTRVFATFGQPNWLAAYLLLTLPLAAWLAISPLDSIPNSTHTSAKLRKKQSSIQAKTPIHWLWLITAGANFITLIFTGSRSGFLAWITALLILCGGTAWLRWQQPKAWHLSGTITGLLLALTFLGSVILGTPFTPKAQELVVRYFVPRAQQLTQTTTPTNQTNTPSAPLPASGTVLENGGTDSGAIRKIVWKGAINVWKQYPLFGSGVETFAYSYYGQRPIEHNTVSEWDYLYNKAHNEFLNILATSGLLGLGTLLVFMISFTWFSATPFWKSISASKTEERATGVLFTSESLALLLVLLAGYAALAVSNFFGFSTVMVAVLFFLWPAIAETLLETELNAPLPLSATKKHQTSPLSAWSVLGQVITVGVATWGLVLVFAMWNNDRLFAQAKQLVNQGELPTAYQTLTTLTQRAPNEPVYWEEASLTLAKLAVGIAEQDATIAAQLAGEAVRASDTSLQLNAVHPNYWKSRVRVMLYLAQLNPEALREAARAAEAARILAPTDAKLAYNLAVIYDTLNERDKAQQAYEETLRLRPRYEQALAAYAAFFEKYQQPEKAFEYYQRVLQLKPDDAESQERLKALTASLSAQRAAP